MGVTATTRLPAGWYPDPEGGDRRRWWDGREWTEYTAAFQRPTSVDELDLEPTASTKATGKKRAKSSKAAEKPAKPARSTRPARPAKAPRPIRVETGPDTSGEATVRAPLRRRSAEQLGRWLAGATHALPLARAKKQHGRRANRSSK